MNKKVHSIKETATVFVYSGLLLFLELACIRFLPAQFTHLGYFTNFILIACFLGIGLGFLLARNNLNLSRFFLPSLFLALFVSIVSSIQISLSSGDVIFFQAQTNKTISLSVYVLIPCIFIGISWVFMNVTHAMAKIFRSSKKPLELYIFDVLGSIIGIVLFSIFSWLGVPPVIWFCTIGVIFSLIFYGKKSLLISFVWVLSVLILFSFDRSQNETYWSPYQKLSLFKNEGRYELFANTTSHQSFYDISQTPFYSLIYTRYFREVPPKDVLIIGSGTGQDVAAAIAAGVTHVDAVEIDPVIYEIGKKYHPNKPYDDPRVSVYIQDGRYFLKHTNKKYDAVIYALTDSLLLSGSSQVRLESFLFTIEGFSDAKKVLKPDGKFIAYNEYRNTWLIERIRLMMTAVFGQSPSEIGQLGSFRAFVSQNSSFERVKQIKTQLPADDWPFLYIQHHTIPSLYLVMIGILLVVSIISEILANGSMQLPQKPIFWRLVVFFFTGTAFSLIETKSIVQLHLLFGGTWQVSAIAFVGILVTVFAATMLSIRYPFKRVPWLFALLFALLIVQYAIPVSSLMFVSSVLRFLVSVLYFYLPIGVANGIFAQLFHDSPSADLDLGANLLGLVVGGFLEYTAMIFGYSSLSICAIFLYICAYGAYSRYTRKK